MSDFKVGDKVEAFGVEGDVINDDINDDWGDVYPIFVHFENGHHVSFTSDGKSHKWHKTPSLKLIERPKKTRVFKEFVNTAGLISGYLLDDDFNDVGKKCRKDDFLMWTGREFELEVEG